MNCSEVDCEKRGLTYVALIGQSRLRSERYFCERHGSEYIGHYLDNRVLGPQPLEKLEGSIACELRFLLLRRNPKIGYLHFEEIGGTRWFSSYLDYYDGLTLLNAIRNLGSSPRISINDLLVELIRVFDGKFKYVLIEQEFYDYAHPPKMCLNTKNGESMVSMGFGDAISLAISLGAPIHISEELVREGRCLE